MKRFDLNKSHGVPYDWHLDPHAYTEPDAPWVHETDVAALQALLDESLRAPGWQSVKRLAADNARLRAALERAAGALGHFACTVQSRRQSELAQRREREAREALEKKP